MEEQKEDTQVGGIDTSEAPEPEWAEVGEKPPEEPAINGMPLWVEVERRIESGDNNSPPLVHSFAAICREVGPLVKVTNLELEMYEREPAMRESANVDLTGLNVVEQGLLISALHVLGMFMAGPGRGTIQELLFRLAELNKEAFAGVTQEERDLAIKAQDAVMHDRMAEFLNITPKELDEQQAAADVQIIDEKITEDGAEGPTLH